MKSSIVLIALFMVLTMAGSASAQSSGPILDFSETFDSAGNDVVKMIYAGAYDPTLKLYEATVLGPAEACFENRATSRPRGVDQDKTLWNWRHATRTYELKWTVKRGTKDSCRVLFASSDGRIDSADFLIWQRNLGSTTTSLQSDTKADEPAAAYGDGSVRSISYSIEIR